MMRPNLDGLVAVVTGAGRGLGRAHAIRLAAAGSAVLVNDVGANPSGQGTDLAVAETVSAEIVAAGGRAVANADSVASFEGAERIIDAAVEHFGSVDILINNAGFVTSTALSDLDEARLLSLMSVHFIGAVGTMKAAIPRMLGGGFGRVVNTVSETSFDHRTETSLGYGAAKAAVWSATLAAARRVEGTSVTVNGLSPGARTRTSAAHLDAVGSPPDLDLAPERVADVVALLVSREMADVNGRIVHTAGGVVREYCVERRRDTDLVERLSASL